MCEQFRWSEDKRDDLNAACRALANYHTTSYPINENDGDAVTTSRKKLYQVETKTYQCKQKSELKCRESRKHRVSCYLSHKNSSDVRGLKLTTSNAGNALSHLHLSSLANL